MSFRATYFGWQGWLFDTGRACVAIDPLLLDEIGRGPRRTRIDFVFREAREVALDRLPPLDALVITHEHEDHFNIPTLVRLDRRVPLYVSRRVSAAARGLLAELGFRVTYVDHGDTIAIEDLEVRLFGADQTPGVASFDEWDTLAYLARHRGGSGGLFSNVDISISSEMSEVMRDTRARDRALLMFVGGEVSLFDGEPPTVAAGDHPQGGAATPFELMALRLRAGNRVVPRPGCTFELEPGELVGVAPQTDFLRTIPGPPRVPRHAFALAPGVIPETSVLGANASERDRPELEAALRELAEYLYGRHTYRYLTTVPARYRGRRAHTFAFVFLTAPGAPEWFYEYVPGACAFRAVDSDFDTVVQGYLGVVMLWVSDYLAVVRGEVEPRAIHRATQEDWAIDDGALPALREVLWSFYHPQRFPDRVLAQYRRAVELEGGDAVGRWARRAARTESPSRRSHAVPRPSASDVFRDAPPRAGQRQTARAARNDDAAGRAPARKQGRRVKRGGRRSTR